MATKKANARLPDVPLPNRLDHESAKWFSRFIKYVLQPPGKRSVEQIFQDEQEATKKGAKGSAGQQRPGGAWHRAYVAYQWENRVAEYDAAVAVTEAVELASLRKEARARRASLVSQFIESASSLLTSPGVFAAAPAGVSAAVLRAVEASRSEFGADNLPEDEERGAKNFPRGLPPPEVRIFLDDGSGNLLPFDEWPVPDRLNPDFHPEADGSEAPPEPASQPTGTM